MNLSMNIHNSTDLFALKTAMNLLRVGCQENSLGKMADRRPIGLLSSQSLPLCYSSGRFPKRESCPVRGVWHLFAAGYVSFFGHAQWMDAGYLRARCMVKK